MMMITTINVNDDDDDNDNDHVFRQQPTITSIILKQEDLEVVKQEDKKHM